MKPLIKKNMGIRNVMKRLPISVSLNDIPKQNSSTWANTTNNMVNPRKASIYPILGFIVIILNYLKRLISALAATIIAGLIRNLQISFPPYSLHLKPSTYI